MELGCRLTIRLVTYGERFRALRRERWKGKGKTVLALAKRLGSEYASTIYNIEKQWRVPSLATLTKHAEALGCQPWDLLVDVETEYDLVRHLADARDDEAQREWRALFGRYKKTTWRSSRTDPPLGEASTPRARPRRTVAR